MKAYKQKFGFLTDSMSEKYLIFLKQQILKLEPKFYAVIHNREITTPDGKMHALHITTDIEHPGFESIAEGWINNQFIYLWRNHCWGIAVNKSDKQMIQYDNRSINPITIKGFGLELRSSYLNKAILIFKIGIDEI